MTELGAQYEAQVEGRVATPDELPLQFADFATWERRHVRPGSGEWSAELDWWERHLTPSPSPFALPFASAPGAPAPSGERGAVDAELDAERAAALDRLGAVSGATMFMTRLAAFSALVGLETGAEDLTLDTYLSLRRSVGLQAMVGPLFNRAVLRLRFSDRLGFGEWVSRVRTEVVEVSRHGTVPYVEVMNELGRRGVRRPPGGTRLSVLTEPPPVRFGGIEVETLPRHHIAPWGFALGVRRESGGDRWRAAFDSRLHDPGGVADFLAGLKSLIAAACAEPTRPLAQLHRELGSDRSRAKEAAPMFHVVATIEVEDFERWRQAFDEDAFGRARTARGYEILRSVEQPNVVSVRTMFDSVIAATEFSARLRAREDAGVIAPATVLEVTDSGTY
jgi:hypothetical protein